MIAGQISEADVRNVPENHSKENMLDKLHWVRGLSDEEEILTWNLERFNVSWKYSWNEELVLKEEKCAKKTKQNY